MLIDFVNQVTPHFHAGVIHHLFTSVFQLRKAKSSLTGSQETPIPAVESLEYAYDDVNTQVCPLIEEMANAYEGESFPYGDTQSPIPLVPLLRFDFGSTFLFPQNNDKFG